MRSQEALEESFSSDTIPSRLEIYINHLTILVHCPPQIMLFVINLYEDFIDVEGVTVTLMLSFQTAGIFCAEFDAPEADRFVRDGNASFSESIFDISMTHIESVIDPYRVADDFWRESVSLVSIHWPILAIPTSLFVSTVKRFWVTDAAQNPCFFEEREQHECRRFVAHRKSNEIRTNSA